VTTNLRRLLEGAWIVEYTKKRVTERDALANQIANMAETAAKEDRALTESENASIDSMTASLKDLDAELRRFKGFADAVGSFTKLDDAAAEKRETRAVEESNLSWGEQFIRSAAFTEYRGRGTSGRVTIETRALPLTLTSMAPAISRTKRLVEDAEFPAPLLDLIPTITVNSNGFDVVRFAKVAGGAAIVAEGAAKPSVEYAPNLAPITLDTIAAYTQYSRQLSEDEPAIVSRINSELQREIARKLESESAAALAGATLPAVTGATLLEAVRVGIGTVQSEGYRPNAVLLNPADWAAMDIAVMGVTLLGPSVGSQFWGLRPVASIAQPAGTATVGDFTAGVERYSRSGISLYQTDSHADTFTLNVLTILAETRSKTVVVHPDAFAEAAAGAGTTTASAPASKK